MVSDGLVRPYTVYIHEEGFVKKKEGVFEKFLVVMIWCV